MTPFRGRLKIRHLEVVLAVADLGNLARAALQLHTTQSSLSRALVEIEELLGGRIFERTAKGMICTPLGEATCRHARVLLNDLRKAETDLAAYSHGNQGSLAIGCFSLFAGWPMAQATRRFCERYPDVELTVHVGAHENLIEALDRSAIDLLLSRLPASINPALYHAVPIGSDPAVLACAPGHPLASAAPTLEDCVPYPWITPLRGTPLRNALQARLHHLHLREPTCIGAMSLEFGHAMIRDNRHLWMLPGHIASVMATEGRVCVLPVELGLEPRTLGVIWRRDRAGGRHNVTFADIVAAVVNEHPYH